MVAMMNSARVKTNRAYLIMTFGEKCAYCRATEGLTLDHIIAKALGGTNERSNLQLLCQPCNNHKSVLEQQVCRVKEWRN